jgi:hypothetical protein
MRTVDELVDVAEPSWPVLVGSLSSSFTPVAILPAEPGQCRSSLLQLQVTVRSPLGAIALNSGGMLVHGGWLRIFGGSRSGGSSGLPSIAEVNQFPAVYDPSWVPEGGLVLAHDIFGGVFALNGVDPVAAGRPGESGEITYFCPVKLSWEAMGMGHADWLGWLVSGALDDFYGDLLWSGWRTEVYGLGMRDGISRIPLPGGLDGVADTRRQAVPMSRLLASYAEFCGQMALDDPGFLGRYPVMI